jgi:hypothetical protein
MAGRGATLELKITGDASGARRALDDAEGSAGRFGGVMGKMTGGLVAGAAVAGAALIGIGTKAFQAASDLEQATGAIDSVFGDWALDIEQAAQGAARSVGLSTSAYENLAAVLGAQLKGAGMPIADVTNKTQDLIGVGADLAATFGGTSADAVAALSSALKGEMDPLERYGITLSQAKIQAELAARGQDDLTGSALATAKATATMDLIMQGAGGALGAAARESGTAASALQQLSAMSDNMLAALGERLLPVVAGFATFVMDSVLPVMSTWVGQGGALSVAWQAVSDFVTGSLIPGVQALWAELGPKLIPAWQTMGSTMTDIVVPAFRGIWDIISNYVFPIISAVLGPAIDGVQQLWQTLGEKLADNRDKFQGVYDKVKPLLEFLRDTVAPFIGGALKLAFQGLSQVIGPVIDSIAWILDKAGSVAGFIGNVGSAVGGLFGAPAAAGAAGAPGLFGAAPSGLVGAAGSLPSGGTSPSAGGKGSTPIITGGDTYHITVSGVLTEGEAGAKIEQILARHARRTGRALAGAV